MGWGRGLTGVEKVHQAADEDLVSGSVFRNTKEGLGSTDDPRSRTPRKMFRLCLEAKFEMWFTQERSWLITRPRSLRN